MLEETPLLLSHNTVMAFLTNSSIDKHVLSLGIFTLNVAPGDWAMIPLDLFASMHLSEQSEVPGNPLKGAFLLKVWILLGSCLIVAFCFSLFQGVICPSLIISYFLFGCPGLLVEIPALL